MKFNCIISSSRIVLLSFFAWSCSSTPTIVTHHRVIPNKRTDSAGAAKGSNNVKQSAPGPFDLAVSESEQDAIEPLSVNTQSIPPPQQETISQPPASPLLTTTSPVVTSASVVEAHALPPPQMVDNNPHSTISYPVESQKLGVILPITGKNSSVGQNALNSIRLGLGLTDGSSKINLVIYDSQGSPELAAQGVDKLVKDDHVVAILGGLSSKEAQSIANKAEFYRTPYFSFSQKSGITQNNDYIFRNAVTSEMQVEKLVQYATQKLGAKKFAVLYPNDPYGVEFANKYWDLVLAAGGEMTAAQTYDPQDTNLDIYIQKLVGTYFVDARIEEYKERLKEIQLKKKKKTEDPNFKKNSREKETKELVLSSITDFDVLFVPDTSKALGQIMAFMKNNDVTKVTYLGTNLWNSSDLGRRVGPQSESLFFVDSAASEEIENNSEFKQKYQQQYNETPSIVEAQMYEVGKIFKELLAKNYSSREDLNADLATLGERQGAYGPIRMNNTHEIERGLHIYGLKDSKPNLIE